MNATVQRYYNQARSWEHRQEDTPTLTKTYKVIAKVLRAGGEMFYCHIIAGQVEARL